MQKRRNRTTIVAAVAAMAFAIAGPAAGAEDERIHGDGSVPFWPHETGALVGTSETFIDVGDDGSYYDPSVGRRVYAAAQIAP